LKGLREVWEGLNADLVGREWRDTSLGVMKEN
jgi:hypothetical protein